MICLDTHILLAIVDDALRADELRVVEGFWAISDIVLWEIGHLERAGRIRPILRTPELSEVLGRTTVFPINLPVAEALRRLDFRSDPADEIIAATSVVHDIPLLTRDQRILSSKIVPLALRG
ncbi:MAG: PIN domain-containing protein [Dehalococcoidia bacterium]